MPPQSISGIDLWFFWKKGYYSGIRAPFLAQPVAFKPKKMEEDDDAEDELDLIYFQNKESLPEEEKQRGEEEGPCTSYS